MRILFYLPVVTELWFDHVLAPLIRAAAKDAEVHVIVPPLWSMTGITARQLAGCADLTEVHWHILDGEDHPSYRMTPAAPDALVDFVGRIDPDYTFCRSADVTTPGRFPGQVRYLMEGGFPPLPPDGAPRWGYAMVQGPNLFDHGFLPDLDERRNAWLDEQIAPVWNILQARYHHVGDRRSYLAEAGLPTDRKIIAVPLEYDAPDNFFDKVHSVDASNDRFVATLANQIDDDFLLAVTIHPVQEKLRSAVVDRIAAMDRNKVRIVRAPGDGAGGVTRLLIQHCDGVVLRDSKSFVNAAFFAKPLLRLSRFASADWLRAYTDVPTFLEALRSGTARSADDADVRTWFAYHYANNAFPVGDPDMTLADLLDRANRPCNPARWQAHLDRHRACFDAWIASHALEPA